jgi:hypothetical protein
MVAATAEDLAVTRCIGCGKEIEDGEKVYRILKGGMRGGEFDERSEYGDLHESCFHRSVESPRSVLEEVRRISRKARKSRQKE